MADTDILTADYLAEHYVTAFYATLAGAVADLNAGIRENADAPKETAAAALYTDSKGNSHLTLLADAELAAGLELTAPVIFKVNGYTVSLLGDFAITFSADNIILDCRVEGSQIIKNVDAVSNASTAVAFSGMNCQVLGGYIRATSADPTVTVGAILQSAGSLTIDGVRIYVRVTSGDMNAVGITAKSDLRIQNATVNAIAANGNGVGMQSSGDCYIDSCAFGAVTASANTSKMACGFASGTKSYEIKNSQFKVSAPNTYARGIYAAGSGSVVKSDISAEAESGKAYGVYAYAGGNWSVADCKIFTNSIYGMTCEGGSGCHNSSGCTMNLENNDIFADGTDNSVVYEGYAGTQGITNYGTMTVKNCNVYGTHTGFRCLSGSVTEIDGGVFEGVGHGGVYIAMGEAGTFYAQNATFRNTPYRGQNKAFYHFGNLLYHTAAVYIGGSAGGNMKAYFDSCVIDGYGPALVPDGDNFVGAEPIRFRGASGETNNAIYISNCTIKGDGKIRFTNATHKLYCGYWNRIQCEANLPDCVVQLGKVVYTGYGMQRTF